MKGFGFLVDSKIARVGKEYATKSDVPVDEAIRQFLTSGTCKALKNRDTGLYLEVFECVYDMFLEEAGEVVE